MCRKNVCEKSSPSQALPRQLPQRGSQAINLDAKVLSAMRKIPAVLLALPLGELAKPEALTERAYAVALSAKGVKCNKKLSRRAAASAGSRRGSCRLPLRPLPVKMQCRSVRRRSGIALLKIFFPLIMAKAYAAAIENRPAAAQTLTGFLPGRTDPSRLPRRPYCQRPPARRRTARQTGQRPVL